MFRVQHFSESLGGVVTIRAFRALRRFQTDNSLKIEQNITVSGFCGFQFGRCPKSSSFAAAPHPLG